MSRLALRRYRAERLLRRDFSAARAKVLAVVRSRLRAKGVWLDPADLEACYAQAWQGLYAAVLGGQQIENPSAWLVLVTFRRAIDESRCSSRSQVGGGARSAAFDPHFPEERRRAVVEPDIAAALDDRARLRHVFEGLRDRLSERECEAASLCYMQGLSRAEAAARLGISEARMRKLMEGSGPGRPGVAGKVGELLDTIRGGGWCEQQSSLMRAYAFGVLDPDGARHARAVSHCRECPACRAYVASLRGLAAVLPPLPLPARLLLNGRPGAATGASAAARAGAGTGSLTAKLAVTGLIVLGGGYAVVDSHAHGSPAARHVIPAQSSVGKEPSLASRSRPGAAVHRRGSDRHSTASHAHAVSGARSTREPVALEFSPEQVRSQHAGTSARAARASGEFGFE